MESPLYVQVSNEVVKAISAGLIPTSSKLPGARRLATLLGTSRRTIILAYEELEAQGWVDIMPNKGVFISSKIPVARPRKLSDLNEEKAHMAVSHFSLNNRLDYLEYLDLYIYP